MRLFHRARRLGANCRRLRPVVEGLEGRALLSVVAAAPTSRHGNHARAETAGAIRETGTVASGEPGAAQALAGARVRLYQATAGQPRLVGQGTTDEAGQFAIRVAPRDAATDGIFYATADLGHRVQLASIAGTDLSRPVAINELTTVAAGYSLAQFLRHGRVSGDPVGLRTAALMNENLVTPATGATSPVLLGAPNAYQTDSLQSLRALGNILALYVRGDGRGIGSFLAMARDPGAGTPAVLQAVSNIARSPGRNVSALYDLAGREPVYTPSLAAQPDAWTLAVKVNFTGNDQYLFAGPGNIAFDARGYAWITNNDVQGQPYSGQFAVVLKPNGQPADGADGTPRSPLLGGGLLGGGYGVTVEPSGRVWFGNFGWGTSDHYPSPEGNGSLSLFDASGNPLSGPLGIQGGPVRVQGVATDKQGNLWITSFGNDRVYVFPKGDPSRSIFYQFPAGSDPFDVKIFRDGTAYISNAGGLVIGPGSVARLALKGDQLVPLWLTNVGSAIKAIAVDPRGNAWLASGGDSAVYLISPQGKVLHKYTGVGGMDSPWGLTLDGNGNVWVGNFGLIAPNSDYTHAGVTELAGPNRSRRPPGLRLGDAITPSTGYTLPTGGDQVLLHDGTPLYGPQGPPSFSPLMRMTSLVIDRGGNLWATNNFKPSWNIDASPTTGNPGGDGIVIFVGLARPTSGTR